MSSNLKIYNICGYGSTGSSAVVNLLEEYTTCKHIPGEFRFIQDPDGVIDLCTNLTDNWGWNRSDAYIRRFIHYTNVIGRRIGPFHYGEHLNKFFNYRFFDHRDEYLKNIIDTSWKGHWFFHDFNERSTTQTFIDNGKRSLSWHFGFSREWLRKVTRKSEMYFTSPNKDFYKLSQRFLEALFSEVNLQPDDNLIFDQLGLAYHFEKYKMIMPGLKQIVVERDPRDVYLDAINYNAYPITDNIKDFVNFYRGSRSKKYPEINDDCLIIQFEDLIYDYKNTKTNIENFMNIDPQTHLYKETRFVPAISIKNTQTWKRPENHKSLNHIHQIEKLLPEWCYKFD